MICVLDDQLWKSFVWIKVERSDLHLPCPFASLGFVAGNWDSRSIVIQADPNRCSDALAQLP
jgi:hypothetical protein